MTIMVMMSVAAYSSFDGIMAYVRKNGAADSIKGAWAQARARAIEDGIPYRFSIIPGTTRYRVAPDKAEFWSGNPANGSDTDNPPLILDDDLPKGVRFNFKGNAPPAAATNTDAMSDAAPADSGAWQTVAVFLPDGTARDDVEITLAHDGTNSIMLRLRSLTGTVKTVTGKESR